MPPPRTDAPPARSPIVGSGMAVLAGWFVTVVAAVMLWVPTLPDSTPDPDQCVGWCLSPREHLTLVLLLGVPVLVVSIGAGTLLVIAFAAARLRSGVVAGTVAAVVAIGSVPGALVALAILRAVTGSTA